MRGRFSDRRRPRDRIGGLSTPVRRGPDRSRDVEGNDGPGSVQKDLENRIHTHGVKGLSFRSPTGTRRTRVQTRDLSSEECQVRRTRSRTPETSQGTVPRSAGREGRGSGPLRDEEGPSRQILSELIRSVESLDRYPPRLGVSTRTTPPESVPTVPYSRPGSRRRGPDPRGTAQQNGDTRSQIVSS